MVWTAHPGLPIRPATEDLLPEGSVTTAGAILGAYGDVWLQTTN